LIGSQHQAFGYYGLQASLFELRPDRLLTSLARHSPQGDGGCLLITQVAMHGAGPASLSAFLGFVSHLSAKALPKDAGTLDTDCPFR
jgi:hypothetical protein